MKINPIQPSITMQGSSVAKKLRKGLWFTGMLISELGIAAKDVFKKEKKYYIEINGKMIDERDLPCFVSKHDDWVGTAWGRVIFSPEDEEKLNSMPFEERGAYRSQLLRQGKYTLTKPVVKDW